MAAMFGGDDDDLQEVGCLELALFADPWLGKQFMCSEGAYETGSHFRQSAVLKVSPARS